MNNLFSYLVIFIFLVVISFLLMNELRKSWQVQKLTKQAKELEIEDKGNPFNMTILSKALNLYKECHQLSKNPQFRETAARIEEQLEDRHRFQNLFNQGREHLKQAYYQLALSYFLDAQKLYPLARVKFEITNCQFQCQKEENYTATLTQAHQLAKEGKFLEAITLVKGALAEFSRADGKKFLSQLETVLKGKEKFYAGLRAENTGQLHEAIFNYKEAIKIVPELIEARTRLGILAIKNQNWNDALEQLKDISNDQATYLRGFAYAQQKNWRQAEREWKFHWDSQVQEQRQTLKTLAQRERLLTIKAIEQFVDEGQYEKAQSTSLNFLEKFGAETLVESNLEGHIQPHLEAQHWETKNWEKIAIKTEQNWLEHQDITSLHNWAIATYYQSQSNTKKLPNLIIAWSTALANININPSLKDLPWLGNNSIDTTQVFQNLTKLLEDLIDEVKEQNIETYVQLRDLYRQEMAALNIMGNSPACGIKVKNSCFITPGCYQHYRSKLPKIDLPAQLWGALYTDWGRSVSACIEGNTARAIEIKPGFVQSPAEQFAKLFVAYHEGVYYLQQYHWRKAINPLKNAKERIKSTSDWYQEIDRLCLLQRQNIDDFDEHLDFAQFWYEVLASQDAKSYLAEYKARNIAEKLSNKQIAEQKALSELNELKKIDPNNSIVIDLIDTIEFFKEAEKIERLIKQNKFEESIRLAKYSRHQKIRYRMAEMCLEILLKGVEGGNLSFEMIHQLGHWAYELCPNEPNFKSIYRSLRIPY